MGPWLLWLLRQLRNERFRSWLLATAGPRALALFMVWLERVRQRQIAIGEADQIDGMFSAAIIDGNRHVIVWKDGTPVSAYPAIDGDLEQKLRLHARRGLTRPDDLPSRRARRRLAELAGRTRGGALRVVEAAGRVRHGDRLGGLAGRVRDGAGRLGAPARTVRRLLTRGGDGPQ